MLRNVCQLELLEGLCPAAHMEGTMGRSDTALQGCTGFEAKHLCDFAKGMWELCIEDKTAAFKEKMCKLRL